MYSVSKNNKNKQMKEGRKEGREERKGEEGRKEEKKRKEKKENKKNCLKQTDVNKSNNRKISFQKSIRQFGPCACKSKLLQL